jgi:transcriptional regulator with XRE-family HTH domain
LARNEAVGGRVKAAAEEKKELGRATTPVDSVEVTETVGDRIRRYRRYRGLTQQALADLASVDKSYISRLEAGEVADPGLEIVERLAAALQVSLRQLADPRWYAGVPAELPDWEAAILALPAKTLSDEDKETVVRLIRALIAAKKAAVALVPLASLATDLI